MLRTKAHVEVHHHALTTNLFHIKAYATTECQLLFQSIEIDK